MKRYAVYVIENSKGQVYKGVTTDITKRLDYHNRGLSKWTRGKGPFIVVYKEHYKDKSEALKREKFLKSGQGREFLKRVINGL